MWIRHKVVLSMPSELGYGVCNHCGLRLAPWEYNDKGHMWTWYVRRYAMYR